MSPQHIVATCIFSFWGLSQVFCIAIMLNASKPGTALIHAVLAGLAGVGIGCIVTG